MTTPNEPMVCHSVMEDG